MTKIAWVGSLRTPDPVKAHRDTVVQMDLGYGPSIDLPRLEDREMARVAPFVVNIR